MPATACPGSWPVVCPQIPYHPQLTVKEWSLTSPKHEPIRLLMGQVLLAVHYLHSKNVVHGRLSWHSVVVDPDQVPAPLTPIPHPAPPPMPSAAGHPSPTVC